MPEAAGPEVATGASLLDELILAYMPENLAWWIAWPFALLGLALCLLGYYAYRLVVAVAAGVSGGAVVVIAGPDLLALEGTALLTTAGGSAIILLVLGSFFYRASVFVVGAGNRLRHRRAVLVSGLRPRRAGRRGSHPQRMESLPDSSSAPSCPPSPSASSSSAGNGDS